MNSKSFISLLLLLVSCRHSNLSSDPPMITVSGKFTNWSESQRNAGDIILKIHDYLSRDDKTYICEIKSDGSFKTAFPKEHPQDFNLSIGNQTVYLWAKPGSEIILEIDAERIKQDGAAALSFKGDHAETNRQINHFLPVFDQRRQELLEDHQKKIKELEADDYKSFRLKRYQEERQFFSDYSKKYPVNAEAGKWINLGIKYECADDLLSYIRIHPEANDWAPDTFQVPESYFSFLEEFETRNGDAVANSIFSVFLFNYEYYLRMVKLNKLLVPDLNGWARVLMQVGELAPDESVYLQNIQNLPNDQLRQEKRLIELLEKNELFICRKYLSGYYNNYINFLFTDLKGYAKDFCLSRLFYDMINGRMNFLELLQPHIPRYTEEVESTYLKDRVLKKFAEVRAPLADSTLMEGVKFVDLPKGNAAELFENIISKYQGKVVYVDFWATWCVPCRKEFAFSNKLHQKLENRDVAFVYLCNRSPENLWKAAVKEYQLRGDHYLLENESYQILEQKFHIDTIPHYVLVDRNGKVVSPDAKRPSVNYASLNTQLLAEINELLKFRTLRNALK